MGVATPWLPVAGFTTSYCVDDILAVDRKTTIFSRWLVWRVLAAGRT